MTQFLKMAETQARCIYPFESGGPGELSVTNDEVLTILQQDVGDGWWEAKNSRGEQGLVPESYLEVVSVPEPSFPPPPPPAAIQIPAQRSSWKQPAPPQAQPSRGSVSPTWQQKPPTPTWNQPSQPPPAQQPPEPVNSYPPPRTAQMKAQDSYDDWDDDDWDSDDDESVTSEKTSAQGSGSTSTNQKHKKGDSDNKFGTVRKPFSRFSNFAKQGGEAYLFNTAPDTVSERDKTAVIFEGPDGPCWKPIADAYNCTITSPKKASKYHGMKSYIVYQITPSFSNIQVSRRYKHFDWLHDRLEEKFSSIVIPPLPDKQISGRFEEDFIAERMRQLQLWVDRLCKHPIVAHAEVFNHFLSCTDEKKWKAGKRKAEKDEYLGVKFFLTVQAPSMPLDTVSMEKKMERFSRYIKNMDDSVKHLLNVGESNMKKHWGPFRKEYQKLGSSFTALAKSFEYDERPSAQALTQALEDTGRTYNDIGKSFADQPTQDLHPFMEGLMEYKGILSTFPDIFSVSRAATAKIQENAGKLSELELQAVQNRADVISYSTLAEMSHFQNYRVGDFKALIQNYLHGQIQFYRQITERLEQTAARYNDA